MGGDGADGQVSITYTQLTYKSSILSVSAASTAPWCAGETRNVQVTIQNTGTATWSDASPDINIGVKWNTNGANWTDYHIRTNAGNLAPGATTTYTLPLTASNNVGSGYTTPLAAGTNNLIFDVVYEGISWFGDNGGGVGPGNSKFTTPAITINPIPVAPTGSASQSFCSTSSPTVANLTATGTTIKWYAASSGGTALVTTTPVVNGAHYYASQTNASGCESSLRFDVTATVYTPLTGITYGQNPATYCAGIAIASNNPTITGGVATSYSVSPALPAGLTLNAGTGAISGTSTATNGAAAAYYTITATNICGSVSVPLNITISPAAPTSLNYTSNTPSYCVGAPITNNNPSNSGGAPTGYSISPALPAGLSIDPVTGVISGTPTATAASATYTVTAANSCGSTTKGLVIIVTSPPLSISYGVNPAVYCAGVAIANNNPTVTGGTPTTYSVSPALPAGLSLNAGTGVISGTPTTTNGIAAVDYLVTASNTCGSAAIAVNITISPAAPTVLNYTVTSPLYCVGIAIANNNPSNTGGAPSLYSVSPALPAGLSLNTSTGVISGTPAAVTASATYTVTASNSCGSTTKALTIAVTTTPSITYSTNPAVYCAGQAIAANNPSNTGGTVTSYSVSPALPAGLTLNTSTGVITGTPTTTNGVSSTNYTVSSTNSCGTTTVAVNITISPAAPTALNYTVTSPLYCVGIAIANNNPSNTGGGPSLYSISPALPAGLSLNTTTGVISGTPAAVTASATYTVTASNSCGSTTKALTIAVTTTPSITYSTNPAVYCAGQAIAANNPSNTGGTVTSYSVSPALPAGLMLNTSTGIITGTPTTTNGVSSTNYTVSSTNSCGTTTVAVNITISPAAPTALNYTLTPATYCVGTAIANNNPSNSGGAPTSYSVSPALPAGLSLNTNTGVISGTATAASAATNYTVTATNSCGNTTKVVNIKVNTPASISTDPVTQTLCVGQPVTFSVTAGGTSPAYQWRKNGANIAGATSSSYNIASVTAASAGNYDVVVTVSPCGSVTSAIATLTVTPNSTVTLTSPAGTDAQTVCTNIALANVTYSIGGSATGASITAGTLPAGVAGSISSGIFTISGTPTGSGTFNYTVTTTGPCAQASLSGTITVKPIPTGTLTATETSGLANNDNIICTGATVTFTATAGATLYKFYKTDAANVTTVAQNASASNTYSSSTLNNGDKISVEVFNSVSCATFFNTVTITVNPLPAPTLVADKTTICPGEDVIFTASGGTSYTFKVNGGSVQSGVSGTFVTNSLNNGDAVTVEVTNANGCKATFAPTINITVNTVPSGTLTPSPGTTICAGDNVTFAASGSFTSYEFKVNGTNVQGPSASGTYSTTSLANASVVTVVATNASGCSASFNPVAMTVNAVPAGTLTVTENSGTPNDNSICANAPVTFTFTNGFSNYNFKVNGVSKQNNASNSYINSTLINGDVVTVEVTNSNNCKAISTAPVITIAPSPSGTVSASASTICSGDNVTFTATSDPAFTNYIFKVNGAPVQNSGANTYSTTSLVNGDIITVDVTNSNSCVSTFGPVTMVVNALPIGTLTSVENSGNTPDDGIICTGATVVFTAPTGFTNYDFILNGLTVQSGGSRTYTNSTLNNGDVVKVAVTNGSNCIGLLNPVTITVNTLPVVQPINGTLNVCVNNTTALSVITPGGVWSSASTGIATIDVAGVVTGVASGTSVINYTVTNANGCVTVVTVTVTVNALPVVAAITGNGDVCVGNTTQFNNVTGGGAWGSDNTVIATVDASGLVSGVSAGTANISYIVTNGSGCVTTVTKVVTVHPLPVVAAITGTLSVCVNATTTLAEATSGGIWTSGNTAVATVNATGVVTGVSDGTATISYNVADGNGCTTTVTADVVVYALPVPTLSGANPICPNTTETYTTESGQSNYTWTFTGGTLVSGGTSTDNTITILWNQPGARTIFVNYTNANGCSGITSATLTTSTGTVPTLTGTNPVCLNSDGNYTSQTGQTDYTWIVVGGTISAGGTATDNTATVNWTSSGTQSVSINFTDASGCIAAAPTVLQVTVRPLPTATVNGTTSVCEGSSSPNITFTGAGSTAPYTFTYNINGGANQTVVSVGNSATVAAPTGTAGTFTYNLVSVQDASSTNCSQTQTGSATITVNPLPTATISGATSVCQNATSPDVTFTGAVGTAPFTFSYKINGGATQMITTTSGNSVTVAAPTGIAGSFTYSLVSVSDANSCSQAQAGSVVITVNQLPTATISGTVSICENGLPPNITFTGASGTAPYIFSYNINGGGTLTVASVGNAATVPAPTTTDGVFVYNLVSVQDASATLCSQTQAGAATVTVNPASVGGSVAPGATVCSGSNSGTLNLTGQTGSVVRWESSTDGGITWTPVAHTTTFLIYTNITQSTQYRAVVQSGVCSSANSSSVTISVNPVSAGGSVTANATVCSGTNSGTLTLAGHTGAVVRWESSINGGSTWTTVANTTNSQTYNNLTQTTLYRAVVQSGVCPSVNSSFATITVNPLPTATIGADVSVCQNAASPTIIFTGANGIAPYIFTYKINGSANLTVASVGNTATVSAPTGAVGTFTYTLVSVQDGSSATCSQAMSGSASVIVSAPTPITSVTASPATICLGSSSNLFIPNGAGTASLLSEDFEGTNSFTVANTAPHSSGSEWTLRNSSYTYSYGCFWIFCNSVTFNSGSKFMVLTSADYNNTNTSLISPSISTVGYTSLNLQYRTYYRNNSSDIAVVEVSVNNGTSWTTVQDVQAAGSLGTSQNFSTQNINLNAYINNASLMIRFRYKSNDNWWWAVDDINITGSAPSAKYSWSAMPSATAGLPAGSGTPSVGNANITVTPTASGNYAYTATLTNAAGCTSTKDVSLTVNPLPAVTISADYCVVPGKVRLTANATPGSTLKWNPGGATTPYIDVDLAGSYDVTATIGGCSFTAYISVASELVSNGDFESGNTGLTSDYTYKADVPGLVPAGQGELYDDTGTNGYSITTDGQNVHTSFWGKDHTTGTGKFMAVNGHGNTLVVWKQTVNVLPNTTYYFSAWAMSLNNAGPFAQLRFSVNGTLVGTTAVLASGVNNNSNNGWVRFYGTWTSGPATTTADIYINDLQPSAPGNDFGLDDVSFATLSTFINLISAPGTDAQTVCSNTAIDNIVYSVGNGNASGPSVTGLPAGVTSLFGGDKLTISGTPTVAGTYTYTITTTGCAPVSVTGTITVESQTISLSSGSKSPTVCINAPVNIGFTIGGTATGATVSGLPTGVTLGLSGSTVTISGTSAVAGTYPYTITTTPATGACTPATISGTISVKEQTITLNSAAATTNQGVCINTSITNIQYTVGGTGNGASVSGLPPGVTGTYNSGIFIISGTPTSAAGSPYTYAVTTSGPSCTPATATGTITITPAATLTLTSAAGTNAQTVCINTAITDITYNVLNATNASVAGLPAGVSGAFTAGIFTITGSPSASGTFNYTVTTSGGCGIATATGTINVQVETVTLSSGSASPSLCINTAMPAITYTIGGTATGGNVTGLPAGVTFAVAGNVITISGTPTVSGPFPYTVTATGNCGMVTTSGTITVQPSATGGTLTSVSICSGASGSLTLAGQVGNIQGWEYSTDFGVTWTPIANTSITQSYTNIITTTMYRARVSNGCGPVYSSVGTVGVHNLWTGLINTDWNVAGNWSDNQLPSTSCPDVYIPNTTNKPILSGAPVSTITNLHILAGATVTINGSGVLQVGGSITNAGIFDVSLGKIEFNGSAAQNITAGTFMGNAIYDLVISNSAGVTLGGGVDVYRSLTYNKNGAILNTGGYLTLKSTISETAWVGDMTSHIINGDVTVERYIATGSVHPKSWQLLAIPTVGPTLSTGQNIKNAWQEGASATNVSSPAPGSAGNPKAGYGTMITSAVASAASQPTPGFDAYTSPGPSMKTFNYITNGYDAGPANTQVAIYNQKGYMVLVRGDRSVYTSSGAANPTTLRTTGKLFTPANLPPATTVIGNKFESMGNPYASAIDIRKLTKTGGVDEFIYVWDPQLGGNYSLGAFVTLSLSGDGNYYAIPQSPTYGPGPHNYIQSGQAFLVQATGTNGNVSFTESAKSSGSMLVTTPARNPQLVPKLMTNLYGINADGSTILNDGVLNTFGDSYSNGVDGKDARKNANTAENLSIKVAGTLLSVERRQIPAKQDTIFLNLTGVRVQSYRFELIAANLNTGGLQGYFEDNYMHTSTPLNMDGITTADITIVNIPGSYASDRFRIVFTTAPDVVLPVTFTSVKAYRQAANISVEWKVENEMNINNYSVEKSGDGIHFTTLVVQTATGNGGTSANYQVLDDHPVTGYNYYRIRSNDRDGKTHLTQVVKVLMGSMKRDITIYPNPITDGMIHLQFMNEPEGKYGIRLLNKLGQIILRKEVTRMDGSNTELIKWDFNLAHGMYQLEITKPDGGTKTINVMY